MNMEKLDIEKLIERLLHNYECVILPDFGGFIIRDSPCNFNAAKDKLKPYGKHIFFNPHLAQNDGLLYNEIQKSKQLSYQEAITSYQSWLATFKQSISDMGSKSFGQLGTFYQGNENNVWFSPFSTLNLAMDSYGLFPVDVKQVLKEKMVEPLVEQHIALEVEQKESLADNKPIVSIEPARLNYKGWLVAASIALAAHIGYLSFEKSDITVNEASVIPLIDDKTSKYDSSKIADSASMQENAQDSDTVSQTAVEETKPVETTPTPVIETHPAPEQPVVEQVVETPKENEPAPVEPIIPAVEKPLNKLAKYKLETNANYHRDDLAKKGIKAEVRQNGEWFEVVTEEPVQ
jgi:hypothetical protein